MNYNSTYQRKNNVKYHFGGPSEETPSPDLDASNLSFFYQICAFPHPKTGKYQMRKFVVNSKNEFINIQDYYLNKNQCRKFFATKRDHEYRSYPTYSLSDVTRPHMSEILMSKSQIMNNNYDYTGFAPF